MKTFWDRTAKIYDRFMRKDQEAYRQMYALIRPVVRHKQVLELAAGTGLIAKNIVHSADHIEATDASEEMIRQAKQGVQSAKLHFSVQDMFCLPYAAQSFDVVIVWKGRETMINPYELKDERALGLIQGYVIDVKDKGDCNMLLFKKDTMDRASDLISVAAWAPQAGQDTPDMKAMTDDVKGKFIACIVIIRKKEKNGKLYTNYDMKYLIKPPVGKTA